MTPMPIAAQIANWSAQFKDEDIPEHVLKCAKISLLDAIGVALAATTYSEAARQALAVLVNLEHGGSSTIFQKGSATSLENAVFANGLLIRALDFNDYLPKDPNDGRRLGSHPSDNMAVGLAFGEKFHSTGRSFLAAMVLGYELNGRLLRLFDHHSFWDSTTATSLVAPVIASRLMTLNHDQMTSAIAFSMAHGATHKSVRRGHISAAKFLADPIVARHGAFATLLAAGNVVGPLSVLDGSNSLAKAVFGEGDVADLLLPLKPFYIFEGVCIKAYPFFANSQAAIGAALDLRKQLGDSVRDIKRIDLFLADIPAVTSQLDDQNRRYPTNQETADHSYHFAVAVALADGLVSLRSFRNERWRDPEIKALMDKIHILPDPIWNERVNGGAPARLNIKTYDGTRLTSEQAFQLGHISNPMSLDQIIGKFKLNVDGIIAAERSNAIIDIVLNLEHETSLHPLMSLLGER
ncbi:MAG: MmgE/PrpD family protein [Alphaproteobacteria bacterium]|nr:MmgE/PrpD family protein [Alphaproteobacteria bacterium]